MKNAIGILQAYAEYCAWVRSFLPDTPYQRLEVHIPYWMNPMSAGADRHYGSGILTVEVSVWHTFFRKKGQMRWMHADISFRERRTVRNWGPEEDVDPLSLLITEGTRSYPDGRKLGLLNWIAPSLKGAIGQQIPWTRCPRPIAETATDAARIHLQDPTADDVRLILGLISLNAHPQQFPAKPRRQLVFDVDDNLLSIGVREIETDR